MWDQFARCQHSAWISQRAKLKCKTQSVFLTAALIDVLQVFVGQSVVPQKRGFIGGKIKQRSALSFCQNIAAGHEKCTY